MRRRRSSIFVESESAKSLIWFVASRAGALTFAWIDAPSCRCTSWNFCAFLASGRSSARPSDQKRIAALFALLARSQSSWEPGALQRLHQFAAAPSALEQQRSRRHRRRSLDRKDVCRRSSRSSSTLICARPRSGHARPRSSATRARRRAAARACSRRAAHEDARSRLG